MQDCYGGDQLRDLGLPRHPHRHRLPPRVPRLRLLLQAGATSVGGGAVLVVFFNGNVCHIYPSLYTYLLLLTFAARNACVAFSLVHLSLSDSHTSRILIYLCLACVCVCFRRQCARAKSLPESPQDGPCY